MSKRTRAVSRLGRAALVAALGIGVLGGCGGGGGDKAKSAGDNAPVKLAPLPKVDPADVKALVGRWDGAGKDYFQFKTDGSGVWRKDGQTLWSGLAIPDEKGKLRFRFSWQGGDPKSGNYWGATVSDDGGKMTFSGTGQTYTKASGGKSGDDKSPSDGKSPSGKPGDGKSPSGKPTSPKGH
ncbi:hypothetical protein [Actinomadura rupiterrae]|uniref:hypothetical protein n=1 Tax=Actinomadura rupiterrae TaxID=559627 RepID=UPI0020A5CDEC|nr:hypothetical protein [Actinomadura rupiterrae]MCP2339060.1 hypothetical protein [Actinomadura rupiterrae]